MALAPDPVLFPPCRAHGSPRLTCILQVSRESIFNKMNSSNLACVFGLNLIWPSQGAASLSALVPLNLFTELLIEHHGKVFSAQDARGEPCAGPAGQESRVAPSPVASPCPLRLHPLAAARSLR